MDPPLSLSFLSALFPLIFAPKARIVLPIPEFSKGKKIKVEKARGKEGGGGSKGWNQRRIDANKKRRKESEREGRGRWGVDSVL